MLIAPPSLREVLDAVDPIRLVGRIRTARGSLLTCTLPAAVGDRCLVVRSGPAGGLLGEIIGFVDETAYLLLYEHGELRPGLEVVRLGHGSTIPTGRGLLGRVVDGLGRPLDGAGPLRGCLTRTVRPRVPAPLTRKRIREIFTTGVRTIDGLLTCGKGQRLGIFAGSGVGKSTLLGEIAKNADADINVIALVGERGREVQPFLEDCLGMQGMQRSVVILATADQTPLLRIRAVQAAITVADAFRTEGAHVLLLCDSLTRLAMAQRELGLALGEPSTARGYTPSVFQLLADLVERLGNDDRGSITGILTVLVEGGDLDEPIADAVRSLVDGHIILDRKLAEQGHYPAIDIGRSVSRVSGDVADAAHREAARKLLAMQAVFAEAEDLIRIGAYVAGSSPMVDRALELRPRLLRFLRQGMDEGSSLAETRAALFALAKDWPF